MPTYSGKSVRHQLSQISLSVHGTFLPVALENFSRSAESFSAFLRALDNLIPPFIEALDVFGIPKQSLLLLLVFTHPFKQDLHIPRVRLSSWTHRVLLSMLVGNSHHSVLTTPTPATSLTTHFDIV